MTNNSKKNQLFPFWKQLKKAPHSPTAIFECEDMHHRK
nr:MAG TPA: hypothetical protein [Caudoviricetes sp.]